MILHYLISIYLLINISLQDDSIQQTLYNYNNSTLYVRLSNNDLLSIPFKQFFNSSNTSGLVSSLLPSPKTYSTITIINDDLYAFYDQDEEIAVDLYNGSDWNSVDLVNSSKFYNYSSYLTTLDDTNKVYIYGGISPSNTSDITGRVILFDIETLSFTDNISTTVSPTDFYGASNILINYNTQLVIGGKSSAGWVGLKQLAMWQYESWSFRSVDNYQGINSRKFAQLLPIFSDEESQDIVENDQGSTVNIEGLISLGGELINDLASPNVLKLNVTGGSSRGWSWSSLDDDLNLDLDNVLGSCVIYETLITFTDNSSSKQKRSDTTSYSMNLYDVSNNIGSIKTVDYTSTTILKTTKSNSNNKNVVIAVSVVVPVLVLALIGAACFFYIKWKNNQDPTSNYESFDIMDFYNNHSKKSSLAFNHDEVKVNDYEDNDNLSISSWRRKREEFERANAKKKPLRELPFLPTINPVEQQQQPVPQRNESILKKSLSRISKTFSLNAGKPNMKSVPKINEDEYENLKSRSTLQLVEESPYKMVNDSRSIFSNSTYYEDGESPIKQSPFLNSNRFSDLTMLLNQTNEKLIPDDDDADDNIDVQVLVSSKRRSKLRVMNPDEPQSHCKNPSSVPEVAEDEQYLSELFEVIGDIDFETDGDGTRKRVVSGENNIDEV